MANPKNHIPASKNSPKPNQPGQMQIAMAQRSYQGPVPSAEELQKYEMTSPGLAQQLVDMAKKEQDARIKNNEMIILAETDSIRDEISLKKRGQWFAVGSVSIIVGLCAYAFYLGYETAGATIATGVIVALASAFMFSKSQSKKEIA